MNGSFPYLDEDELGGIELFRQVPLESIKGLIDARLDLHADQHIASQQKARLDKPGLLILKQPHRLVVGLQQA